MAKKTKTKVKVREQKTFGRNSKELPRNMIYFETGEKTFTVILADKKGKISATPEELKFLLGQKVNLSLFRNGTIYLYGYNKSFAYRINRILAK